MKKKTSKNTGKHPEGWQAKNSPKGMVVQKIKNPDLKVVKESQVVYLSKKNDSKLLHYTDENLGKTEIVNDFLPSPDELVLKDVTVKVTLNLSKSSIDFFKSLAEKNGSQYQKIIRNLLDSYSANFKK